MAAVRGDFWLPCKWYARFPSAISIWNRVAGRYRLGRNRLCKWAFRWVNLAILLLPLRLIRPPSDPHQPQGAGGGGGAGSLRSSYGYQCTTGRQRLRTTKIWQSSISANGVLTDRPMGGWVWFGTLFLSPVEASRRKKTLNAKLMMVWGNLCLSKYFCLPLGGKIGWRSNKIETFWNIFEPKMETLVISKIEIEFFKATCGESYCEPTA